MKNLPLIAIVGEPNVGKSTLMNKIAGQRLAVTSEIAGTTRDRQYIDTSWNGVDFTMVDTAGITFTKTEELEAELNEQIDHALQEADALMLVVDSKTDPQVMDRKALLKFRKSKKPVVLVVNKVDSPKLVESAAAPFAQLGVKAMYSVSSVSGRGIGDLLDEVATILKEIPAEDVTPPTGIAVSIIGKPNVGKSSLVNHLLGNKRVVVSNIPGTTRTAIDTHANIDGEDYTFIDTAGLKKKEHRQKLPDIYSGFQTFRAMRRSDVVMFMIDATQPVTKQDQSIAGEILDMSKPAIILVNKMDAYDGDEEKLKDYVSLHFPFLWFCPVFFISADTGAGIKEALGAVKSVFDSNRKTAEPEQVEKLLESILKTNPPRRMLDQREPKVYGLAQVDVNPPSFELEVNRSGAISEEFRRYLMKQVIKRLDFWGTPIKIYYKEQ